MRMSLLSRFRQTVLPSSSRNKKLTDRDVNHYNYRKPTKSFNEKSVNSKKSTSHYTDSHTNDNNNHHCNGEGKNLRSSSKHQLPKTSTSKSSSQLGANKNKINNHSSVDNATLSRSNTFTLDEEEKFQNGFHEKFKRKNDFSDVDGKNYYYRQIGPNHGKANNNVNKDVFETFYSKRTSRSSHSSKSSNDSGRSADDTTPTHNKPNPYSINDRPVRAPATPYKYDSMAKNSINSNNVQSEKSKPLQYLFGSTFNQTNKDEREKENIYASADPKNSDRFKTITINNLRRSFRESFLDSTKPAKGREHQQLWFIDANDEKKKSNQFELNNNSFKKSTEVVDNTTDPCGNRQRTKVKRNETFRVDNDESLFNSKPTTSLNRRETFRVNGGPSPGDRERLRTPSADSNESYSLTINKVIPVAVTTPYNSLNDIDDNNRFTRKNLFTQHKNKDNECDENEDVIEQNYEDFDNKYSKQEFSSSRDNSPLRHDKYINSNVKPNKMPIEFNSPSYKNKYVTSEPFEKRFNPKRQSFHDFKSESIDRPRANRSYASLRSKLAQAGSNLTHKPISSIYNEDDDSIDKSMNKMCLNKPTDAWRRISTRQFNIKDSDTENRSFVPYHNKFNTYDRPKSNNNCNRTTININYNYNMNLPSIKDPSMELKPKREYDTPKLVNKSTSAIKSNSGKDKSNKNRSVNFPSVECEVRLISPNYDTKPRRKESWKSKPMNDWTFNKVHL